MSKRRVVSVSLILLAGCHRATPAAPAAACPILPVALVVTPPTGETRTILALDVEGSLDVSFLQRKTHAAKLDARGCLVGPDGLWAEWAPQDKLWTPHETLAVAGDCLPVSSGRSLCIAADGKVEARANGKPEAPGAGGTMAIRGYRPEARCAGMLLLATFMSMMPSMAAVDGHPARAPAPEGSRCGGFRRP